MAKENIVTTTECLPTSHNFISEGRVEEYGSIQSNIYLVLYCTKCGKVIKEKIRERITFKEMD